MCNTHVSHVVGLQLRSGTTDVQHTHISHVVGLQLPSGTTDVQNIHQLCSGITVTQWDYRRANTHISHVVGLQRCNTHVSHVAGLQLRSGTTDVQNTRQSCSGTTVT